MPVDGRRGFDEEDFLLFGVGVEAPGDDLYDRLNPTRHRFPVDVLHESANEREQLQILPNKLSFFCSTHVHRDTVPTRVAI